MGRGSISIRIILLNKIVLTPINWVNNSVIVDIAQIFNISSSTLFHKLKIDGMIRIIEVYIRNRRPIYVLYRPELNSMYE